MTLFMLTIPEVPPKIDGHDGFGQASGRLRAGFSCFALFRWPFWRKLVNVHLAHAQYTPTYIVGYKAGQSDITNRLFILLYVNSFLSWFTWLSLQISCNKIRSLFSDNNKSPCFIRKSYESQTRSRTTKKLVNETVTMPVKSGLRREPISFHNSLSCPLGRR